jgi:hypothetical protein
VAHDRIVRPASTAKLRQIPPIKGNYEFREFPGRSHWIIAQPGWEEVAGFVAEWLEAGL